MTECQQEPLMLSTFYNYFLQWYIDNFDEIVEVLKEWMAVYRSIQSDIHPRLQEAQFCLEAAFKLFLTYRQEKGFISREESLDEYNAFYNQLRTAVIEQNNRVNQTTCIKPINVDYLKIIRSLYQDKRFRLVGSAKDFEAKEHDGIIHKNHLYLRSNKLMARINTFEPFAEFDDVLEDLKSQQALKAGKDSNSKKIAGSSLRFYAIKLLKLH